MKNGTVIGVVLLCYLLLPSPAATQTRSRKSVPASRRSADSTKTGLKETSDWIREKVLAYASFQQKSGDERETMFIAYKVDSLEFEGCTINLQATETISFSSDTELTTNVQKTKASLSDLDVSRTTVQQRTDVSPTQFYLQIPTVGDQMKITVHSETLKAGISRVMDYTAKQFSLTFTDADIVPRMEKAFATAVQLCKDKREPF